MLIISFDIQNIIFFSVLLKKWFYFSCVLWYINPCELFNAKSANVVRLLAEWFET